MQNVFTILFLLFSIPAYAGAPVHFIDPWMREAPPNARVLGAFVSMHNPGKEPVVLQGASGKDFGHIEMHMTVFEDGMARMKPQNQLVIEGGKALKMQPGGYHIMLFDPKKPFREGETTTITLDFGKDGKHDVELKVRMMSGGMQHNH